MHANFASKNDEKPRNQVALTLLVENLLRSQSDGSAFPREPLYQALGVEKLEQWVFLVQFLNAEDHLGALSLFKWALTRRAFLVLNRR
jgi:hypothetical protein